MRVTATTVPSFYRRVFTRGSQGLGFVEDGRYLLRIIDDDETVRLLLMYDANVLAKTAKKLIALHRAAGRGHISVVRLLLSQGSPVEETIWNG